MRQCDRYPTNGTPEGSVFPRTSSPGPETDTVYREGLWLDLVRDGDVGGAYWWDDRAELEAEDAHRRLRRCMYGGNASRTNVVFVSTEDAGAIMSGTSINI